MNTLLISHPDCLKHARDRHPERPERLTAVLNELHRTGIEQDLIRLAATEISHTQLHLVHPEAFVQKVEATEQPGKIARLDSDTYMSEGSGRAAKLAAGAVYQAAEQVLRGVAKRAFCAVRPPGHHAEIAASLGFCLFNNVAIGAQQALNHPDIKRIAILDFDVHHCNGTVDIFKDEPRVLVCSSFREHFYPHRYLDFSNDHIINTPLPVGLKGYGFRKQIEADWIPAIHQQQPDLIFVSAGFDAHQADPLGGLQLIEDDYRWVTQLICDMANDYAQGRVISTLEGGYDLIALANSARVHVEVLMSQS